MAWTRESLLAYVADERHLIEAIEDTTADPATVALIEAWFEAVDL